MEGEEEKVKTKPFFVMPKAASIIINRAFKIRILHFDALDLDAPGLGGLVERGLHGRGYALPIAQDLVKVLRAEDVSQRRLSQQPR